MTTKTKKVVEDIVQVVPVVEESTADPRTVEVLSAQDSVADLVKETPAVEDTERAVRVLKERKLTSILELPEKCYPLHKVKYRYRWLAKDKNLEAKIRTSIWMLCTRQNSPYIKKHRFKSHGAIEQGGMLVYAGEAVAKIREEEPAKRSAELVKHYTEDLAKQGNPQKGGFYQPESTDDGESDEGLEMD